MRLFLSLTIFALFVFTGLPIAQANVKQLKVYRKVYPNFKPQCIYCHIDKKPKKADGKHDLNAYGLKVQKLMNGEPLTEEMLQTLGSHEEFEAQQESSDTEEMSSNETPGADDTEQLSANEILKETKNAREMVAETNIVNKKISAQIDTSITGAPQDFAKTSPEGSASE